MRPLEHTLVLGYHSLSVGWDNSVAVHPARFRGQMEMLLEAGYRSVTFTEAVARPEQRVVAVTFDDGFLAVHELALPVLEELGMVGTLFTPTSFMAGCSSLTWDGYDGRDRGDVKEMTALSWELARDLVAHGWEIGSHTRTHPHLPRLDDDRLLEELRVSREECEAGTGAPCTSIAYPYGELDQRVRDAAATAGYSAGAALGPQWRRHDPLWWPRTGVYRSDDLRRFHLKLQPLLRTRAFAAGMATARRAGVARG